jgi:hypothetical protein
MTFQNGGKESKLHLLAIGYVAAERIAQSAMPKLREAERACGNRDFMNIQYGTNKTWKIMLTICISILSNMVM